MEVASWNGKKWEVSASKIMAPEEIEASVELDTDLYDDAYISKKKIKEMPLKIQQFDVSFRVAGVAGVNVLDEFESWKKLVGEKAPFMLNGKQFGPKNMQLEKVELSDGMLDNGGNIVTGTIDVSFQEYAPEKAKEKEALKEKQKAQAKAAKGVKSKSKKKSAKNIKSSTADKTAKKAASSSSSKLSGAVKSSSSTTSSAVNSEATSSAKSSSSTESSKKTATRKTAPPTLATDAGGASSG